MDIDFVNSYTEVVLENFDAVLKQNLMFQTQLKVAEKRKSDSEELFRKLEEKDSSIVVLEQTISALQSELSGLNNLKQRVVDTDSVINEKNRIQQALNESMQSNSYLQSLVSEKDVNINQLTSVIENLKRYISQLEEIAPVSKLKKLNATKEESAPSDDDLNTLKVQSGSGF